MERKRKICTNCQINVLNLDGRKSGMISCQLVDPYRENGKTEQAILIGAGGDRERSSKVAGFQLGVRDHGAGGIERNTGDRTLIA
jgi:hypothetical protein